MPKPLALSIALCLGLTGCQVFTKSEVWEEAVRVRPGSSTHNPDPSHDYAARLHEALQQRGIEHKVVTYQYRYRTRLREEAVGTRTAVIYRDDKRPSYPWWLKDDRLNTPFWLPNGDLNKQVSFYIRHTAEVIETKNYPGHSAGGKQTVALRANPPAPRSLAAKSGLVTKLQKPAVVQTPARKLEAPPVRVTKQSSRHARQQPVTRIAAVSTSAQKAAPQPAPEKKTPGVEKVAPIAAGPVGNLLQSLHGNPFEHSAGVAAKSDEMETSFRRKHGTTYNQFSATDRRKMEHLRRGAEGE